MSQPAVAFRAPLQNDATSLARFFKDGKSWLDACGIEDLPLSPKDCRDWLNRISSADEDRVYVGFEGDELVVVAGVDFVPRFAGACLWYAVAPEHRGKGLAAQAAVFGMTAFKEERKQKQKVLQQWVIHARETNEASQKIAKKLGFARFRQFDYTSTSCLGGKHLMVGYRKPVIM